jgi:DNA (cytosine-5)-methyltransferase 1
MSFVGHPDLIPTIDLFAGVGGLSIGLREANFDVLAACEWDDDACDTFAKHHTATDLIRGDLGSPEALERIRAYRGTVRVVAGGPPCQPWSSGGLRRGGEDPRNGFPLFLKAVKDLQPDAFIMENVAGVRRAEQRSYYDAFIRDLEALGYSIALQEVNAADYGIPQNRRRVIAVGIRGRSFVFPVPTHGPGRDFEHVVAGDVLSVDQIIGEPNSSIVTFAMRPDLRPNPYDGHLFNGGGRPIQLSRPSPTLLASMGGNKTPWLDTQNVVPPYHAHLIRGGVPRKGLVPGARRITVAEAAVLQTFEIPERSASDGITFAGRRSSQYKQVGNAVPPRLAMVIGTALADQLP